MSNRRFHFANRFQTMISAIRAAPLRVLLLAVAVVGLMTLTDLPSAAPAHAQEQQVTATRDATGDTPPDRPTNLQASAEPDSVSLTWTASTDETVTDYAVLRRDRNDDDVGVFHVIDSNAGSGLSYTDSSVSPEGSYVYRVKAVSPTGVSQWSSYVSVDTPAADPEDLAPSGLSAKVVSDDDGVIEGVALAWDAPAEEAASVTGYEILRAVGDVEMATLVADTGSAGATYTDDTATEAGESYAYRVKALRGEEASQPSDQALAIIPKVTVSPSEPPIADRQTATEIWSATLSVQDVEDGDRGCHIAAGGSTARCSNALTDDTFDYDNTSYSVSFFFLYASGDLILGLNTTPTEDTIADLTLNIGGSPFPLSSASLSASSFTWTNSGLSWTVSDSVALTLTEGAGSTNEEENATPVFTSAATFSVEENQTLVGTVMATDADAGDAVSYAVTGGADQAHFEIDASSGILTFATAPDHENPGDDGDNNVYLVTVTATGGTGARALTATQDITVTVTDVDEPPAATVVWTATLNPADIGLLGCTDASPVLMHQCSQPSRLSEDQVQYDGTTYLVTSIGYFGSIEPIGSMVFDTNPDLPAEAVADLTLNIGDTSLLLSEATGTNFNVQFEWLNSGVSMAVDTDVTVSLTGGAEAVAPTVSSVSVSSSPGVGATYAIGDTILVTVLFDQAVTVTGTPRIRLHVGGDDPEHLKWADYTSGSEALVFAYTVQAGDQDGNGIYIEADDLELNGGTIQSAGGTDANLTYTQPGTQSGHKVDGVRPTPVLAVTSDDGASVIILFSEPLHMTTAPASAFSLAVDTGTAPAVSSATASGDKVTLALANVLTSDQAATVTVTYVDPASGDDSAAVQDAAGNDAANFTTGSADVPDVANAIGAGCSIADGCYVVPAEWGLIPDGLGAGAEFRLLFISSVKRNAVSTDIADYNTFVQTAAASGHVAIQDYSILFRVLGSTAAVDARDNTGTRYTGDDTDATDDDSDLGVAIYWLSGAKVVDEYRDFYDGSWSNAGAGKNENGAANENPLITTHSGVYTGSSSDGTENTESIGSIPESRGLGTERVRVSNPALTPSSKVNSPWLGPFYGLSGVFRVQGQVNTAPEFAADTDLRTVPENSLPGTSVGDPVTATDDDGDTLTYTLEGDDALSFGIDSSSGQIQTIAGVTYDHEAKSSYAVTVKADDGKEGTDTIIISIGLSDADEPPSAPNAPTVSP